MASNRSSEDHWWTGCFRPGRGAPFVMQRAYGCQSSLQVATGHLVSNGVPTYERITSPRVVAPIVSPMIAVMSPPSAPLEALISRRACTPHVTDGTASTKARNRLKNAQERRRHRGPRSGSPCDWWAGPYRRQIGRTTGRARRASGVLRDAHEDAEAPHHDADDPRTSPAVAWPEPCWTPPVAAISDLAWLDSTIAMGPRTTPQQSGDKMPRIIDQRAFLLLSIGAP